MNNNIDRLVDKFKSDSNVSHAVKDEIDTIDKAITDYDVEFKKALLEKTEEKYKEALNARGYYKIKNLVDAKAYMVNNEKELNTLLGNLKLWIIRCEYLKMYINDKIDDIYLKIEKENDIEKIYKLLDKADGLMAK